MAHSRSFSVQSVIRGYHVYKAIWDATIDGEVLLCEREVGNIHDTFAVAVKKDGVIIGHCPRKISSLCSIFIRRGGSITCQVSGSRRYSEDLPQGGLEVPCTLIFQILKTQPVEFLDKTERLINAALSMKIELPLPPVVSSESSCASSVATSQPQIKIESVQTDDESQTLDVDQPPTKKQKLRSKEFDDIIMGVELSDLQINMAQNLLKAQFPQLNGLKSTLQQTKHTDIPTEDEVRNKLQIVHCKSRHHWIVATTVKCSNNQVLIIDSLFSSLDDETKATVSQLFQQGTSRPVIKVIRPQKQMGVKDCGLFSIAFATSIAFGHNPAKQKFQQQSMRAHLVNCLENKKMIPFPCL